MVFYWLYKDGKKFCYTDDKEQAENITKASNAAIVEVIKDIKIIK